MNEIKLNVWKTLTLDRFDSVDAIEKALTRKNISVSKFALEVLQGIPLVKDQQKIELIKISPRYLGFTVRDQAQREVILDRAKKIGLRLVPPQVGSQVLLEDPQAPNECVEEGMYIGMNPVSTARGESGIFAIEGTLHAEYDGEGRGPTITSGVPVLSASSGLGIGYDLDSEWIFMR